MPSPIFSVTTPIFYINDVPHVGHAYTAIATDMIARWHRGRGESVYFLTGTDEHGEKILRTAIANGTEPQQWVDTLVDTAWKPALSELAISHDDFIRTTDRRHVEGVKKFLDVLWKNDMIYSGVFTGHYCIGCEEYKQAADLITLPDGTLACALHAIAVETNTEENYFFRLSAFQERLLALYESRPEFIRPESLRNEMVSFVRSGLHDVSISRTTFDWGIELPWNSDHILYVWCDALLNYITAAGYLEEPELFAERWPSLHIVGKDIARFHAVLWPALLMAAEMSVPRGMFGHGWLLVDGEKMSKTKLNGIEPRGMIARFGSDAFRYCLLRSIRFGHDGNFSEDEIHQRYNSELVNGLGNLCARVTTLVEKHFAGLLPHDTFAHIDAEERRILDLCRETTREADAAVERLELHKAIERIWELIVALNAYLTATEPWRLAADPTRMKRVARILHTAVRGLGTVAVLMHPIMPAIAQRLWAAVGGKGKVGDVRLDKADNAPMGEPVHSPGTVLFPRIEIADQH